MPRVVQNAKIALLDIDLRRSKMAMGVQVVVTDPTQLEAIRQRESDITKERIQLLLNAGANVILTTKGIDDMAIKCGRRTPRTQPRPSPKAAPHRGRQRREGASCPAAPPVGSVVAHRAL